MVDVYFIYAYIETITIFNNNGLNGLVFFLHYLSDAK